MDETQNTPGQNAPVHDAITVRIPIVPDTTELDALPDKAERAAQEAADRVRRAFAAVFDEMDDRIRAMARGLESLAVGGGDPVRQAQPESRIDVAREALNMATQAMVEVGQIKVTVEKIADVLDSRLPQDGGGP